MSKINFRNMKLSDYNQLMELWRSIKGIKLRKADSKENIKKYLKRNPSTCFAAVYKSNIIGSVLAGHDGRRGYIYHLSVSKDFRRKNIATELVNKALNKLKNIGINKCHIFILNDNETGKKFWKSIKWNLRNDISVMSKIIKNGD